MGIPAPDEPPEIDDNKYYRISGIAWYFNVIDWKPCEQWSETFFAHEIVLGSVLNSNEWGCFPYQVDKAMAISSIIGPFDSIEEAQNYTA